ncbi:DUF4309 domain-containing protein [Sporosarcina sp. USHLN248]|uniref:YjgB family protein n=1 Tax=Sporosarcina sp. USHLN248 TaxID=3081300 RepID=UPI003016CBD0
MKKMMIYLLLLLLIASIAACGASKSEDDGVVDEEVSEEQNQQIDDKKLTDQAKGNAQSDEEFQKDLSLEMLNNLYEDAKKGKVYKVPNGIYVGKTTRKEVVNRIGEPEEQDDYDHYHGSMGNASYAFRYNQNEILQEARYFGTNVERQTNLGGITEKDLREQLGNPHELRTIDATNETNFIYDLNRYELQFVIGEDGTASHVNLKVK